MVRHYKELDVWKKSVDLADAIYSATDSFPKGEEFGLKSQMRRAAVSIASNIAEGATRKNTKEYIQFLYVANGSLSELDTQMIIAERRKFLKPEGALLILMSDVDRMLHYLIQSLEKRTSTSSTTLTVPTPSTRSVSV